MGFSFFSWPCPTIINNRGRGDSSRGGSAIQSSIYEEGVIPDAINVSAFCTNPHDSQPNTRRKRHAASVSDDGGRKIKTNTRASSPLISAHTKEFDKVSKQYVKKRIWYYPSFNFGFFVDCSNCDVWLFVMVTIWHWKSSTKEKYRVDDKDYSHFLTHTQPEKREIKKKKSSIRKQTKTHIRIYLAHNVS